MKDWALKGLLLGGCLWYSALPAPGQTYKTWSQYGGALDSAQYSSLDQINRSNVSKLEVAWTYPTADGRKYLFNPLVVDNVAFVMAKTNSIVALDAATGKELWAFTPPRTNLITDRGINYWESKDRSDRRLIYASSNILKELDARTGKPVTAFGKDGGVDLREGLGRDPATLKLVQSTTPGKVFENLIILGSATNQGYGSAPGDIRAYDVRTGALVWTFRTIPHPGEFGYDTWPKDAWKTVGGANVWGEFSIDEKRGILYAPTASPKYNFYGADRIGQDLFGDCILALDVRTGKRIWHFQTTHHDIWDYDDCTAPKLLTVRHNGQNVDVIAEVGKSGFIWVLDRVTGKPLWPVVERPVPKSQMPGEQAWPTQPFPTMPPPFARQKFTVNDLSPLLDPQEKEHYKQVLTSARNEGLYTPPGPSTIEMPGNNGGANWSGAAVNPTIGALYVVSKDLPCLLQLVPDPTAPAGVTRFTSEFGFMYSSSGLAPIAAPWSSMTAYDLNTGAIKWRIPLGDVPALADKGIEDTGSHYPKVGPVVTAGGLIFTGERDGKVRVLDANTGKVLWEKQLDAAMEGMPAVYELGGREYVVFCASAQEAIPPSRPSPIKGAYVAFALPARN